MVFQADQVVTHHLRTLNCICRLISLHHNWLQFQVPPAAPSDFLVLAVFLLMENSSSLKVFKK
jgi:hypothetical protein